MSFVPLTGVEPGTHGIFNNTRLGKKIRWKAQLSWVHQILTRGDNTQ
jgi:hypothetical protein